MSTPTPSQPSHPPSASKRPTAAAHNVSTPSHLGHSSPAPRSVPSPAAVRKDQAGKTPTNHPTTGSSSGSKTLGGTPMIQSLSQQGVSPGAGMMAFGTPAGMGLGLGVDMGTPGMAGLTPAMGASMMPTMSELGLTASGGQKRNEDEERKAKLRRILKSIGKPKGRVSEEGIARASRRVGFENDIDDERLTAEEKERKVGNRTITMAGKVVMIEVELKNHEPQGVQVVISGDSAGLEEQNERASKVLLQDLKLEREETMGVILDRFARNIEWMAKIDRSSEKINCFDALSGLYSSLRRLHEQELKINGYDGHERGSDANGKAILQTICKNSGQPVAHEKGRLGLALNYWQDQRTNIPHQHTGNTMDIDGSHAQKQTSDIGNSIYSLRIEVERSAHELYPSLRSSDAWLPVPLELTSPGLLQGIPWQDPPPSFMSSESAGGNGTAMDAANKLPDLRFLAKLDPPIVMPFQTAVNIHNAVGAPAPQAFQGMTPLFHGLLLNATTAQPAINATITADRTVLSIGDNDETEVRYSYRLNVAKPDFGFRLDELPFSHPRQLVELLPTLRQWACTGALLNGIFNTNGQPATAPQAKFNGTPATHDSKFKPMSLDSLLENKGLLSGNLPVDITLATTPTPSLGFNFPSTGNGKEDIEVIALVLPNGDLDMKLAGSKRRDSTADADESVKTKRFACALDATNDLGVWVEWLRGELSGAA